MNRQKIRNRILQQLDYAPYDVSATGFHNFVDSLINEKYLELWHSRPWMFNTKTIPIRIIPDIEGSSTVTAQWAKDGQALTLTEAMTEDASVLDPLRTSTIFPLIIEIESEEYNIIEITNGVGSSIIGVDRPIRQATTVGYEGWKIIQRDIRLPLDCLEVMDIAWRDRVATGLNSIGPSKGIPARLDAYAGLDLGKTGPTPDNYVSLPYQTQEILNSNIVDAVTSINPGVGDFIAGTYYFGVRWYNQRTGAMSGIYEFDHEILPGVAPANFQINLNAPYPNHSFHTFAGKVGTEIIKAVLYRGYLQTDQTIVYYPVYWDKNVADDFPQNPILATTTTSIDGNSTFDTAYTYPRHVDVPQQKFIRFYPRPTGAGGIPDSLGSEGALIQETVQLTFDLRYIYQPPSLQTDTDEPNIPTEFQSMLVDAVLVELYTRSDKPSLAQLPDQRYWDKYKLLSARYSTELDTGVRFGSSWRTAAYQRIPTITYRG